MTYIGKVAPLDLDGLTQAAASIGAAPEALWSLISVETSGCGFLPSRRPKILFERHVFSARTNHQFDTSNPDISNPDPGGYGAPGEPQYERLEAAIQLDETAALESASWGIGQIMGYQATKLGYDDVHAMVSAMCDSEAAQLTAVARFLSVNDIAVALANQRWADVARGYNGRDYARFQYDTKLEANFAAISVSGLPDLRIRATQMMLSFLGIDPHGIDGVLGRQSLAALNTFQTSQGMAATTAVDDDTFAALQAAVGALATS